MALDTSQLRKPRDGSRYVSDHRIYVNDAGELVAADDPTASRLLVGAGATIPNEVAERYGLLGPRKGSSEDKGRKELEDKGDAPEEDKRLEDMTKAELQSVAAERGLAQRGSKDELIARIEEDTAPEDPVLEYAEPEAEPDPFDEPAPADDPFE